MGRGKAPSAHGSQVMRNDVGVNDGIVQIIPEPSYIIQISSFFLPRPPPFFCSPLLLLFYPLSLPCPLAPPSPPNLPLARSLSVQTDLISTPLCSSDTAAPRRAVCRDWNGDQVSRRGRAWQAGPAGRDAEVETHTRRVRLRRASV